MKKKTVRKSGKTPSKTPMRDGKYGGKLKTGNPGNAGGSGRPANWLKDFCDDMLANPKCKAQVEAILGDKKHPAFATMWKACGDRSHGKPRETVMIEGLDKLADSMRAAEDRLARRR